MKLKLLAALFLCANIAHAEGLRPDEMGDLTSNKTEYDQLFGAPLSQPDNIQRMEDILGNSASIVSIEPVSVEAPTQKAVREVVPVPREDVAWSEVWKNVKETSGLVWFKTKETTRTTVSNIAEKSNNLVNNGLNEEQKSMISNALSSTWEKTKSLFEVDKSDVTYVPPVVESKDTSYGKKAPVITQSEFNNVPVFKVREIN